MPRAWTPGNVARAGRIDPDTVAWVDSNIGRIVLKHFEKNPMQGEVGLNHALVIRFFSGGYRTIDVTALTEAEIDAIVEFFILVREEVLPIIRARDEVAREAFDRGDGSFTRSYRALPSVVVQQRASREHNQSLLQRSSGSPEGDTGEYTSNGPRIEGNVLVEPDEEADGTEDDDTQDHKSA